MGNLGAHVIDIRPTSSVYATYRRLSYKPWFALAEFVDNSTQSYFHNKEILVEEYARRGLPFRLRIELFYDPAEKTLMIFDNAFGMELDDFTRAVVLDRPPKNRRGRSEFGMGLKTAACWFGTKWTVETTQLGSSRGFRATVDVDDLARSAPDTVNCDVFSAPTTDHYTKITIYNVQQPIRGRTLTRVRDQLSSIYRQDLRSNEIQIVWNMVPLTFEEPPILEEKISGTTVLWKEPVQFQVPWERGGVSLPVSGWIAVRNPGKQRDAGLVLMRRGRVIVGGPDEGYKPTEVFGQGNTYRSQRLIGELHMDDWPVTQAKDGFDWADGLEDAFIEHLCEVCKNYGAKAEDLRSTQEVKPVTSDDMAKAAAPIREVFQDRSFANWVREEIERPKASAGREAQVELSEQEATPQTEPHQEVHEVEPAQSGMTGTGLTHPDVTPTNPETDKLKSVSQGPIEYRLKLEQTEWTMHLHWQDQLLEAHWMEIDYPQSNRIDVYLNTGHPFFAPYLNERGTLELIQKLVISLALAEKMARLASTEGKVDPGDFRILMNKILRRISDVEGAAQIG